MSYIQLASLALLTISAKDALQGHLVTGEWNKESSPPTPWVFLFLFVPYLGQSTWPQKNFFTIYEKSSPYLTFWQIPILENTMLTM